MELIISQRMADPAARASTKARRQRAKNNWNTMIDGRVDHTRDIVKCPGTVDLLAWGRSGGMQVS